MNSQILSMGLVVIFIVLKQSNLAADIGHFDIYHLKWGSKSCYLTLDSPGRLIDNDLCYYDFNGKYRMEVEDYINRSLSRDKKVYI